MSNYRKLEIGERIQEGDEIRLIQGWEKIVSDSWGQGVPMVSFYRRPILTPEQTANLFREKLAALMEECGVERIYRAANRDTNFICGGEHMRLSWGSVIPKEVRENITSPTQGATEEV